MKKVLAIFSLLLVLGFAGCDSSTGSDSSSSSNALVGTWQMSSSAKGIVSFTFQSNGTLVVKDIVASDTSSDTGTWKVSGNSLTVILSGDTTSGNYAITGSTLTITSGGQASTYTKVSASTATTNSTSTPSSSTSTSNSSSSSSSSTSTTSSVVGLWRSLDVDSTSTSIEKDLVYITFSSNGTFSTVDVYYNKSGSSAATIDTSRTSGTWSVASDKLYITSSDRGNVVMKFSLSGDLLTTIESSTYGNDTTVFTKATSIVLPSYAARVASAAARSASSSTVTAARRHFLF